MGRLAVQRAVPGTFRIDHGHPFRGMFLVQSYHEMTRFSIERSRYRRPNLSSVWLPTKIKANDYRQLIIHLGCTGCSSPASTTLQLTEPQPYPVEDVGTGAMISWAVSFWLWNSSHKS